MSLNLILDAWIPVVHHDGAARVIAPWQIADDTIARLDWPRADLNIACLELLIGLVFLADPPLGPEDWSARRAPDPDRLRDRLSAFAPAFDLLGDGPRFMQDRAVLEGQPNPPDMLFIDSAGGNTIKNNADLMVWRGRYGVLQPAMAAMALYTLQAFAPSGGAGNRTSMRGGGPMVTLVQPEGGLWPLIWANVPDGAAADAAVLPWMRPTVTSEKGRQVFPQQAHPAEAFFGMPRRLRLVCDDGVVTGVIQRPYGTNYAGWDHPLTPFYRVKPGAEWLPKHPRAGVFGYRHWMGVVIGGDSVLTQRAQTVRDWHLRSRGQGARVLVAGWAMDNMKPRDFILSVPPLLPLDPDAEYTVTGMIQAADLLSLALRSALMPVLAEGEAREALREAFYMHTQAAFEARLAALSAGAPAGDVVRGWLADMRGVAMDLFETRALSGLADRNAGDQKAVVDAHRNLSKAFAGYGAYGSKAYAAMSLEQPPKKGKSS